MAKGGKNGATIVIKRIEEGGGGHHGGAWKVAYADFVTAMMAFFLLMWLLNATTEEQRRGIADYFAPTNVLGQSTTGSGQPFGGRTPNESAQLTQNAGAIRLQHGPLPVLEDVEVEEDVPTVARPIPMRDAPEGEDEEAEERRSQQARADAPPGDMDPVEQARIAQLQEEGREAEARALSDAALRAEHERRERAEFERTAEELRNAVAEDPLLAELAQQMRVEQVPEGLRIQLLDADQQPMFALGGAAPNDRARQLLARVTQAVARLPNSIAIAGHTDATPFRGGGDRSNWDLSAERANVTRRLLTEAGLAESRIRSVTGHAARDLLLPETPNAAGNRRVSITLLRDPPPGAATAPATTPPAAAPARPASVTPPAQRAAAPTPSTPRSLVR
ncbi:MULTISPECIES: flagellar motor protein MotB [Roseomonadaceae]|uniref:OmpA family protein n=1 Tax=Falsiroseomonas oleicola TaxID=2801474 RepID=A0ABS6H5G6_9PROT|nr:flagellar motor protein MotB [Roseomonas oleicola]MBU8543704.1 OmpA family protein [Roseomonas oleicola]